MAPTVRSSKKLDKKTVNNNPIDNLSEADKKVVAGDYDIRQALRSLRSYVEKIVKMLAITLLMKLD